MVFEIINESGQRVGVDNLVPGEVYKFRYSRMTSGQSNFQDPVEVIVDDSLKSSLKLSAVGMNNSLIAKNSWIKNNLSQHWINRAEGEMVMEEIKAHKKSVGIARWNTYGESYPQEKQRYNEAKEQVETAKALINSLYAEKYPQVESTQKAFTSAFYRYYNMENLKETVERAPEGADYVFEVEAIYVGKRIDYRKGGESMVWLKADKVKMEREIALSRED